MRKFWSWIRDDGGRVLRLEGPIDEESIWSDGVTPKQFREEKRRCDHLDQQPWRQCVCRG